MEMMIIFIFKNNFIKIISVLVIIEKKMYLKKIINRNNNNK